MQVPLLNLNLNFRRSHRRESYNKKKTVSLVSLEHPNSPASEAFRALRTSLKYSAPKGTYVTIMFTSPGPGEGKSTTLANLAVVLAQAGERVLVIDADLRRPMLHEVFGLSRRVGVTNWLLGRAVLAEVVQAVPQVPDLAVITSGPVPPNPADLMERMARLNLRSLAEGSGDPADPDDPDASADPTAAGFDVVLIDTPPAAVVTDSVVLAPAVDATILVARYGRTRKDRIEAVKARLDQVGSRVLGVVLNDVRSKPGDYYFYYGGYREERGDLPASADSSAAEVAAGEDDEREDYDGQDEREENEREKDGREEYEHLVGRAARLVARTGYANKTLIQQAFRIRSQVAVQILQSLEEAGVVTPPQTPKPRGVLLPVEEVDGRYPEERFPLTDLKIER